MRTATTLLRTLVVLSFLVSMFFEGHAQAVVQFTINPKTLCKINAPVIFTNTSTGLSGAYTWSINFGDGTPAATAPSTVSTISHSYPSTGVAYLAQMTVSSSSNTYTLYVQIYGSNECNSACATASYTCPTAICYNSPVTFYSTSFFPNGPTGYTYSWNFGDPASGVNNTSALKDPTHNFVGAGPFNVKLIVSGTVAGVTCTSTFTKTFQYQTAIDNGVTSLGSILSITPASISQNVPNTYHYTGPAVIFTTTIVQMNFGSGGGWLTVPAPAFSATNTYTAAGSYTMQLIFGHVKCLALLDTVIVIRRDSVKELPCIDCIGSFAPIPGKKYLISAWVKEASAAQSKTSYTYPNIVIKYPSLGTSTAAFLPSGMIIDGWQRLEGEFVIPASATDLQLQLSCTTGNCFFDDIRVLPFDGSMKSYVYDPVNLRLVAELDERNYATLYEYDEEGKLIRVKKENKTGKSTITENRNNSKK